MPLQFSPQEEMDLGNDFQVDVEATFHGDQPLPQDSDTDLTAKQEMDAYLHYIFDKPVGVATFCCHCLTDWTI